MILKSLRPYLCIALLTLFAASALAAEKKEDKKDQPKAAAEKTEKKADKKADAKKDEQKKDDEPEIKTEAVKKGPLRIVVELKGVFEGEEAKEIVLAPEEWSKLTVVSAAKHGARVRKGDVILELETDKLDRAIADLKADLELSEVAIHQAEQRLQALEKITPMNLESKRRDAKFAEEDRDFFFDISRPLHVKSAEIRLKMARATLEYQQEELRQLEKMYKADDITEETEEIVLQRARDNLERAKFGLEVAVLNHGYTVKYSIPRMDIEVKETTDRSILERDQAEAMLPLNLDKQRLELDKLREQRRKADERLEKLTADRKGMEVRSPIGGIVYYGQINRGRPADSSSMERKLTPNGNVSPNQVIMTVVSPRPMFVRATIDEKDLHDMRPGLKGTAVPTGYPDMRLPVEIDQVGDIPYAPGKFDGRLSVRLKGKTKLLMPGMTCKIKLVPYLKKDAILVPPKVLVTDELDEDKQYVEVLDKKGKPVRRNVVVGRKTDEKVEIVKGLKEGDKVVLEPSKDKE